MIMSELLARHLEPHTCVRISYSQATGQYLLRADGTECKAEHRDEHGPRTRIDPGVDHKTLSERALGTTDRAVGLELLLAQARAGDLVRSRYSLREVCRECGVQELCLGRIERPVPVGPDADGEPSSMTRIDRYAVLAYHCGCGYRVETEHSTLRFGLDGELIEDDL